MPQNDNMLFRDIQPGDLIQFPATVDAPEWWFLITGFEPVLDESWVTRHPSHKTMYWVCGISTANNVNERIMYGLPNKRLIEFANASTFLLYRDGELIFTCVPGRV